MYKTVINSLNSNNIIAEEQFRFRGLQRIKLCSFTDEILRILSNETHSGGSLCDLCFDYES